MADEQKPQIAGGLMTSLIKRYGRERGQEVYHSMRGEASGPFAPGAKYHQLHVDFANRNGIPPITKKPRPTRR